MYLRIQKEEGIQKDEGKEKKPGKGCTHPETWAARKWFSVRTAVCILFGLVSEFRSDD